MTDDLLKNKYSKLDTEKDHLDFIKYILDNDIKYCVHIVINTYIKIIRYLIFGEGDLKDILSCIFFWCDVYGALVCEVYMKPKNRLVKDIIKLNNNNSKFLYDGLSNNIIDYIIENCEDDQLDTFYNSAKVDNEQLYIYKKIAYIMPKLNDDLCLLFNDYKYAKKFIIGEVLKNILIKDICDIIADFAS
jgi:hypothetical protein